MIFSLSAQVYAANVNVQLNGTNIDFTDANGEKVEAQIINSRTMVPMRKIFELLNANVEWEASTRTVSATKGDISIKLQIDNEIAEITRNGKTEKTTLDSKPVIVNNRTLVPLRFISESLGKQVGWDSANSTAIIIDYDYFLNRLKEKSPLLYELITSSPNTMNVSVLKTYTDLNTSASNTSKVIANVSKISPNTRNIQLNFSGTSELFKEIVSEGWGNVDLSVTYHEKDVDYSTTNNVLSKTLTNSPETYEELNLSGSANDSFGDMMRKVMGVSDSSLNIGTFSNLKSDYDKLLNLFTFTNGADTSSIRSGAISYSNSKLNYIDYTDFDNIIFDNEFIKTYNVVNKLIFNYDVKLDEMLYDYSNISFSLSLSKQDGAIVASGRAELKNDYNERVVYSVELNQK
ncbi:MAG: copper amine oxidase N-terminal domain-containing protein [Clostridia bacterium]|nr:copper amine oxidase N-terminal domain-containing protein [Clostridia bacterium]